MRRQGGRPSASGPTPATFPTTDNSALEGLTTSASPPHSGQRQPAVREPASHPRQAVGYPHDRVRAVPVSRSGGRSRPERRETGTERASPAKSKPQPRTDARKACLTRPDSHPQRHVWLNRCAEVKGHPKISRPRSYEHRTPTAPVSSPRLCVPKAAPTRAAPLRSATGT
jgi:hypothetical protein